MIYFVHVHAFHIRYFTFYVFIHTQKTDAIYFFAVAGTKYCGPGDWHYNPQNNMCYKLRFDKEVMWLEAHDECQAEGERANLVSIHNFQEQSFINGIVVYSQLQRTINVKL